MRAPEMFHEFVRWFVGAKLNPFPPPKKKKKKWGGNLCRKVVKYEPPVPVTRGVMDWSTPMGPKRSDQAHDNTWLVPTTPSAPLAFGGVGVRNLKEPRLSGHRLVGRT